ncbi:MAG: LytTR family DNA-binding domain-containing protein [bacterium]|nr:LytTR family DNA-binding domain-containing protein [bacterium]
MRILIVEDEAVAARGLERQVRACLGPRVESLSIGATLTASICFLDEHPIDLLLLDLSLHGEDGMRLLGLAAAASFQTIIVSANTDRAVEAFEYGVLDFVPKPVSDDRLARALQRMEGGLPAHAREMRFVSVRGANESAELISLRKILFFQAADNYITIHLDGGRTEKHRKTMDSLMKVLPTNFIRVHRSFVVNMEYAKRLVSESGGRHEIELSGEERLPVSRALYKDIKSRF